MRGPRRTLVVTALLASLLAACRAREPVPPDERFLVAPVRAVDVLDLERAAPAEGWPVRTLVAEAFEGAPEGWRRLGGGEPERLEIGVQEDGALEGHRSLRLGVRGNRPTELPVLGRTVRAESNTSYRLVAMLRAEGLAPRGRHSLGAGIEILELAGTEIVAHHRHLPRERGTSARPRALKYAFSTRETTDALEIRLVGAEGPTTGAAIFDGIRVERLDPRELLGLPGSAREDTMAVRDVAIGDDRRPAIVAAAGSSWALPIHVDDAAVLLRFGSGAPAGIPPDTELCFEIRWEGADPRTVFSECLASGPTWHWHDHDVDLASLVGQSGVLRFEVLAKATSTSIVPGIGAWADPRLLRARSADSRARPDVVIVVIDTLRADRTGFDGYKRRPTSPHLDALAARSLRYARAYSPSPWTAPALGSLLTSRSPHVHDAGRRIPREVWHDPSIPRVPARAVLDYAGLAPGVPTLAERFRAAGYETAGFYANYFFSGAAGFSRGYGSYRGYVGVSEEGARRGVGLALEWLDRLETRDAPAFLVLHLIDPHMPFRMRPSYFETFGPPLDTAAGAVVSEQGSILVEDWEGFEHPKREDLLRIEAMYDSEIAWADEALVPLIDRLREREPAILVVLADHGEGFHEHGHVNHGNTLFDELLRVPLLLRLPGDRLAGTVDETVSLLDVAPTLLSLAGLPALPGAEGRLLAGLPGAAAEARDLFGESMYIGPDRSSIRRGALKYVLTHPPGPLGFKDGEDVSRGPEALLFDTAEDPAETRDLAQALPLVASELRAALLERIARTERGLHLRCPPGERRTIELESESTAVEIKTFGLEPDDAIDLAPTRRALRLDLGGDEPVSPEAGLERGDWIVLRFADTEPVLRAAGAPWGGALEAWSTLGDAPANPDTGTCSAWFVRAPVEPPASPLDEERLDRLRSLGYL